MKDIVEHLKTERHLVTGTRAQYQMMDKATGRIQKAIENEEVIGIFGDYDCDGITATALLVRFFERQGIEPVVRLPHRIRDGYGLQNHIVDEFLAKNVTLLITVDNGITAVEEVTKAQAHGMDTIITDHHYPRETLPDAYAIIHPALDTENEEPHTSGSGVAYDLVCALENDDWEDKDVDTALAMMGLVADVLPLRGWNRVLTVEGLAALARIPKEHPLGILRDTTKAETSEHIAFRVAPRINAAGRMDEPTLALEALLKGQPFINQIHEINTHRQELTEELTQYTRDLHLDLRSPLLCAASQKYTHGIVGLIAGRLTEGFGKPSCIAVVDGDTCIASLRSPPCYHVTEGLGRCSEHLLAFGGHAQAAGCSFLLSEAEAFFAALQEDIAKHTDPRDLLPLLHADAILAAEDVSLSLVADIETLQPFGAGNPQPRFLLQNVRLAKSRLVGATKNHLQCFAGGIKAIGFGLGPLITDTHAPLDLVCRLGIDEWNGRKTPQLYIEDMRLASRESTAPRKKQDTRNKVARD